jgi:hypothetical protein
MDGVDTTHTMWNWLGNSGWYELEWKRDSGEFNDDDDERVEVGVMACSWSIVIKPIVVAACICVFVCNCRSEKLQYSLVENEGMIEGLSHLIRWTKSQS